MKVINLLPKPRQQEARYIAMLRGVWFVFGFSLVSFVLVFLAQSGTLFYLQNQAGRLQAQIADLKAQVNKKENSQVKSQVKAANDLISDFKNLAQTSPKWSKVIEAFMPLPPEGVKINTFSIDPAKKTINITGIAPTRELVIKLHDNIAKDKRDFHDIDYPFENIARAQNVNFHFSFGIQQELFK